MEEQGNSDIEVTVKTLDSQSRSYTVRAQMTVKEFKEHISPSVGIPVDKQRLIYQGRVLQDEKTLTEYNVNGKVIHLVERAPPQTAQPGSGSGGVPGTSGSPQAGNASSSTTSQGMPHGPTHDRNANSYVMLGTLNLPVNIMDPQQIQMSIQQMMSGLGEGVRNTRVSTSTGPSSSVNVHVDMDQSLQSEPRLRLLLAENLLRDTIALIQRLEGQPADGAAPPEDSAPPPTSSTSTPSPSVQPMDTSPPPSSSPPSSAAATDSEGAPPPTSSGPSHPSPAELVEMLAELRRVEERLQPFIQRAHTILEAATTADYNNNTQEREEDQRVLNLVGEALRLLGNALVALSDLRCNLSSAPPRHLHVIRPMSHYTSSVLTPGGVHHMPMQVNLGTTVTMSGNGRPPAESQPHPTGQSEQQGQTPNPQPGMANQQPGQPGPRVIRISHQTMEPVVMMQINVDDAGNAAQNTTAGQPNAAGTGQPGAASNIQIPGLPPEFMQAIVNQVTQQAMAMASAASSGQPGQQIPTPGTGPAAPGTAGTGPAPPGPAGTGPAAPPMPPNPAQARVVFTLPPFTHRMATPSFTTRGTTINLRAAVPPTMGQQPGQAPPLNPAALNQMISVLVGQLLTGASGQNMTSQSTTSSSSHTFTFSTSSSSSSSSSTTSSSNSSSSSSSTFPPTSAAAPAAATSASGPTHSTGPTASSTSQPNAAPMPPQGAPFGGDLDQILGSLLGGGLAAAGQAPGASPSVTVTMPGIPAFIQGVTDFIQASQQANFQPPSEQPTAPTPPPTNNPQSNPEAGAAEEVMNTELFTGIVQGVLSTMMGSLGAPQNNTESIAQFIQRLSQTSNIFTPSTGEAMGFFGDLLTLVCQNFSMVDMVLLLHGQAQPLSRIQPQLAQFFSEHYLQGREPTDANISAAADELIRELDEYITESFSTVTVREGVDITQTNRLFLRQQLTGIATHILRCTDHTFGPGLLQLCNRALFECLALNLYCLRGEQNALTAVINNRIRTMSAEVNPSVVSWLTSMMTMRLQVILEHIPVTEEQILHYVVHARNEEAREVPPPEPVELESVEMEDTRSPTPATTAEEAMATSQEAGAVGGLAEETVGATGGDEPVGEAEAWAAALPPDWVPIIRQDMLTQRKMKAQPPLSDAYLQGMPAKRRKTAQGDGPRLTLSEAVSQAARSAGVTPVTSSSALQGDLERPELQEAYSQQVKNDIKKRVKEDPDFNPRKFPNTHKAFSPDS